MYFDDEYFDKGLDYFMDRPDYDELKDHLYDMYDGAFFAGWNASIFHVNDKDKKPGLSEEEFQEKWEELMELVKAKEEYAREQKKEREAKRQEIIRRSARAMKKLCDRMPEGEPDFDKIEGLLQEIIEDVSNVLRIEDD